MPRGKLLSDEEIGQVKAHHSKGRSNRWIAKTLRRNEKAVSTCLANQRSPRARKKVGRHAVLKKIDVRHAFRLAVHDSLSSRDIARLLPKKPHYTTIIKALHSTHNAKYVKRKPQPAMKQHHKKKRRAYAVINLNHSPLEACERRRQPHGVDRDLLLRQERHCLSGGGTGRCKAHRDAGADSASIHGKPPPGWALGRVVFQHNNASIHSAGATKRFLENQGVGVINWSAKSPDLNLIENVWGILARKVYANRQFPSKVSLKDPIVKAWAEIDVSYLRKLFNSMPTRLGEVIIKNGGPSSY